MSTTSSASTAPADQTIQARATTRAWIALAVLALGALITSVALLALPRISESLHANASEQLWILDSYGFLLAGLVITFSSLADRIGRRRTIMVGAAIFGVASVAAAFSPSSLASSRPAPFAASARRRSRPRSSAR